MRTHLGYTMVSARALLVLTAALAMCAEATPYKITEQRAPCADIEPLRRAYFGDLHVHTRNSFDANMQDTRTTPADAYDFAQGGVLPLQPYAENGSAMRSMQLTRPLDFAAVTDHAELFGEMTICQSPELAGYDSWQCEVYRNWKPASIYLFSSVAGMLKTRPGFCGEEHQNCLAASKIPWQETQDAAEAAYDRSVDCQFTSFVGYEWTGMGPGAANLHRNVIFRNEVVPQLPVDSVEYPTDHALWDGIDAQCIKSDSGCDALIIPHNSNLSDGYMYDGLDDSGEPYTAEQAAQRQRLEPLIEIVQHKGSSECYYGVLRTGTGIAQDELCAFEQLSKRSMGRKFFGSDAPQLDTGFVREILRQGMAIEQRTGVNPYKTGFVGSTDTHISAAGGVAEDGYPGHGGGGQIGRSVQPGALPVGLPDKLEYNPGGLAVVYAEENSRDALFAAMRRKETYATSGPRIGLRFFGGWDYPADLCAASDFVAAGYERGVPMGGDLPARSGKSGDENSVSPVFAVSAMKDAGTESKPGTDLQRLQIIKGWLDADGAPRETVFDVAGNPANGASVDLNTCATSGRGAQNLCAVWRDPAYDAAQHAWYYARVVENPTCRWSQRMCAAKKVRCDDPAGPPEGYEGCCEASHRPIIQERAWSSPIWSAHTQ